MVGVGCAPSEHNSKSKLVKVADACSPSEFEKRVVSSKMIWAESTLQNDKAINLKDPTHLKDLFAELFVGVTGSNANGATVKAWHEAFFVEDTGAFTARDGTVLDDNPY